MAGLRLPFGDREMRVPVFWVDPEEVPVTFLVAKDGATGLAAPDYVSETLHSVEQGDLDLRDAWDHLLIKTPSLPYPKPCQVRHELSGDFRFLVDGQTVFRVTP